MPNWADETARSINEAERKELLSRVRLRDDGDVELFKKTRLYVSAQCTELREQHGLNLLVSEVGGEHEIVVRAINTKRFVRVEFNQYLIVLTVDPQTRKKSAFMIERVDSSWLYRDVDDASLYDYAGLGNLILDAALDRL